MVSDFFGANRQLALKQEGSNLKNRKVRLDSAKKHFEKPAQFWIIWINLNQKYGKKKVWRSLGAAHDRKHITSSVQHSGGGVMVRACVASSWSLVFIDDVIEDSQTSAQISEDDRMVLHFTDGQRPKMYCRSSPEVF